MPHAKPPAARTASPYEGAGSEAVNATVARTAPAVLELLADGVPLSRAAVAEALAGRHDRRDVAHTLIRLAVTGRVVETGGKYTLAAPGPGADWAGQGRPGLPAGRAAPARSVMPAAADDPRHEPRVEVEIRHPPR